MVAFAAPNGSFVEIDAASEVGERHVEGDGEAVVGEDERSEGGEVFEEGSGGAEGGSGEGGGESRT